MLKIAHSPLYKHDLPEGHRFPMEKYELIPQQLLHEGSCSESNFFEPSAPDMEAILAIHDQAYVDSLLNLTIDRRAIRKIGFPVSKTFVDRELHIVQGTIDSAEYALKHGISMNVAGGTHHAYSAHGEGFCMLNDQAVAAQYLLDNYEDSIAKILIIDLDVHQGNGTAKIFQNNDSIFTFSMHGAKNYPFKKETSDLDIDVPDGTEDNAYLYQLKSILPKLIEKQNPDFICYLSGVDILKSDRLGRLNCTVEGCKERDRFVLQSCKNLGIPVQVAMGGGYSTEIKTIVEAHANTFRLAQDIYF